MADYFDYGKPDYVPRSEAQLSINSSALDQAVLHLK
jgi:hypothetical protein